MRIVVYDVNDLLPADGPLFSETTPDQFHTIHIKPHSGVDKIELQYEHDYRATVLLPKGKYTLDDVVVHTAIREAVIFVEVAP